MLDETNNPGEKPRDDGGNAPQPDPEAPADAALMPEKPKDDGGGGA